MSGDVNADGDINILDVVTMVNLILEEPVTTPDGLSLECQELIADTNSDQAVNVLDVVALVTIIIEGTP